MFTIRYWGTYCMLNLMIILASTSCQFILEQPFVSRIYVKFLNFVQLQLLISAIFKLYPLNTRKGTPVPFFNFGSIPGDIMQQKRN